MPAVPAQRTWADNDALDTTNLNGFVSDPIEFLLSPPIAELRQAAAQSLTTATWAAITFGVEDLDTDVDGVGGHSTSTNTSRYTARYPGWYQCSGGVGFASNITGQRGARWAVNGSALNGNQVLEQTAQGSLGTRLPARTKHIFLDEGDFVELQAFQNSGAGLNTDATTENQSSASIRWVSN